MKIIFKFLIIFFFLIILFISYLSIIGIKTTKFNNQIGSIIKNFNKDLEIELEEVKIILDPLNFEINAKTIGPKLKIKDKIIQLESIKTQIVIDNFIKNDFKLKNLDISTRSLKIENLISFTRNFKNSPQLYILEKIIKKGYLICDLRLEFDDQGKIKDNYQIKGFVKDIQLKILKKYNLDKVNFTFNFLDKIFELNDLELTLNDTFFLSEKIIIKNIDKTFLIDGSFKNEKLGLKDEFLVNYVQYFFPKLDLIDINLDTINKFTLQIDKKFKINNLKLSSEIKVTKLIVKNSLELKNFFPNVKKEIILDNHSINVEYDRNNLTVKGKGNFFLQSEADFITYTIQKKKKNFDFDTNIIIDKNPLEVNFLAFQKESGEKAEINLNGSYLLNKSTVIKSFSYRERKNKIEIQKLLLNKNLKIKDFNEINLLYFDKDSRENKIKILKKKDKTFSIAGPKFNANNLMEDLMMNDSNELKIFDQNFNFEIKVDQIFLDKENIIRNLNGNLNFKKNEIVNASLNASFSNDKELKFTIRMNDTGKVTTLFLDRAEPIVKRYKFIKGYTGGTLDFNSLKQGKKSISNLRIYDFRLKELPILTKLLTLASLQGIADILSGEGITFDEFEMNFENQNQLMTISEMYAIGPAISILMDGYVEKNKLVSLRGSLVPATTINKAIGNIPVLGKILVGSKTGEGVFGVSFKIKGPPAKLETTVNPIKTLTPRFITRTLEKIKKN